MSERVLIEEGQRLSRSSLWSRQREYFERRGVAAWVERVPYYITSNLVIAEACAQLAFRYLQDVPLDPAQPIVLVELGTGVGRFGYYVLRALQRLRAVKPLGAPIRYVMTDFTEANLEHLRNHPALKPFLASGELQLARFDAELDSRLDGIATKNPVIVFANYVFDSIRHDLFRVRDGFVEEGLIRLSAPAENGGELDDLSADFEFRRVAPGYYDDEVLDTLIERYRRAHANGDFLVPLGALRCIEALRALCPERLLLIANDRGYDRLDDVGAGHGAGLLFHGSISTLVNFEAVGWWVEANGGHWLRPRVRDGIKSEVFVFGDAPEALPGLRLGFAEHVDGFSPADYYALHRFMREKIGGCPIDTMVSYLQLCRWDPRVFDACFDGIVKQIGEASAATVEAILEGLAQVAASFYFIPGIADTPFQVGALYQRLSRFPEALAQLERSRAFFGENATVTFNIALCHAALDRTPEALAGLKRAADFPETADAARDWLARLDA